MLKIDSQRARKQLTAIGGHSRKNTRGLQNPQRQSPPQTPEDPEAARPRHLWGSRPPQRTLASTVLPEAHEHLDRAQALFTRLNDRVHLAQVEENPGTGHACERTHR